MNPKTNTTSSTPPGIEIISTRVFGAPRETVFGAFENPAHLAHWWGPNGFTNTIKEFDLRPGGVWRLVMHGPDGTDYDNLSNFLEVVKPEKIVFEHVQPVHGFQMTMTYAEVAAGQTRLTWRMVLERSAENEKLKNFLAAANEQNFDRLAACLDSLRLKKAPETQR